MTDQKKYEELNMEARHELTNLACQMQVLLHPADVAQNFLGAGLGVLLTMGDDVTRRWLQKALEGLDDDPARLH
jgi:hypothetical protein